MKRGTGAVRQLPSGQWQAKIRVDGVYHPAGHTFDTKQAARIWLKRQQDDLEAGTWTPPTAGKVGPVLFADFAEEWLARPSAKTGKARAPRTVAEYRKDLDERILPTFGKRPVASIQPRQVQAWYDRLDASKPTQRAHAYSLLASIMTDALRREVIQTNPCRIVGAYASPREERLDLPDPEKVQRLAEAMPTEKYRVLVLLAAWCGLRFGELAELRRKDVHLDADDRPEMLKVRRAVSRVKGASIVGPPKSRAGKRNVAIPPHVADRLADYLDSLPDKPDALLFPGSRSGGHLAPGSLHKVYDPRAEALGLDHVRFHDLRHFAGTQASIAGGTLAEVMARLGHSTVGAAMRYQRAAASRDREIADALSTNVVPLRQRRNA